GRLRHGAPARAQAPREDRPGPVVVLDATRRALAPARGAVRPSSQRARPHGAARRDPAAAGGRPRRRARGGRVMAVPAPHWTWLHGPADSPDPIDEESGMSASVASRYQVHPSDVAAWDSWLGQPLHPITVPAPDAA